jgi:hypothetical protein
VLSLMFTTLFLWRFGGGKAVALLVLNLAMRLVTVAIVVIRSVTVAPDSVWLAGRLSCQLLVAGLCLLAARVAPDPEIFTYTWILYIGSPTRV